MMPTKWTEDQKLFPHQVGFTCPPFDYDAAPSDFLRMSPDSVGVHGWMLHVSDYVHGLDQRKKNFGMLENFVHCMSRNGVDVCGQVGSNWVHASGLGVDGIAQHCAQLSDKYETKFHMAGYAMVEALRFMNVEKIALNGAYHWPEWWQGTAGFLREAGFDVLWAGNFVDQGWFPDQEAVNAKRWIFDGDLFDRSFSYVADKAPTADAYLINGMCNFRSGAGGLPQRPLHLARAMEAKLGTPVIGHDTALYWRIMRDLGIAPTTRKAHYWKAYMHKIIALWAIPRSTSTAFEWMMRQRGDLDCLHEPFGEAWYQGEDPLWPRFKSGDKTTKGLSIESVWEDIQARAAKGPVFLKDFPHYINHMWTPEFLSQFTHAFLIRDPAKTISSIYNKWPDFDELEVGFPEQRALFDLLTALNGTRPAVIDSDDLLEDPETMVAAFCDAVGIDFMSDAMRWEPGGDPSAHSWWDGGSFHANLAQSAGLTPQVRRYLEVADAPERVRRVHRRMKPHYDHLHQYRITPS